MSISLTPNQEHFIQTKLQAGKYRSAEEVLEVALRLFDEYDCAERTLRERAETKWVEDVREQIDQAIAFPTPTNAIALHSPTSAIPLSLHGFFTFRINDTCLGKAITVEC